MSRGSYKKFLIVLWIVLLFWAPIENLCFANENDLILKLFRSSGLNSQIDQIHSSIWLAIPSDAFVNEAVRNESYRKFKKATPAENLATIARNEAQRVFDKEKIESVIKFYETIPGKKLARVQKELLVNHNIKSMREAHKTAALLPEERLELISRIISIQKAAETNAELNATFIDSLLNLPTPKSEKGSAQDELKTSRYSFMTLEKRLIDETIMLSYANNLKSFNDDELMTLINFFETPEATWFMEIVASANRKIVQETGRVLARTISQQTGSSR
jgi:hypothetical protein